MTQHLFFKENDLFLIPSEDNTFLFYAPTLAKLFRIKKELAQRISIYGLSDNSKDTSIAQLTNSLNNVLPNAIKPFPIHLRKSNSFHMALGLTKSCTLRCLYCHADAGKQEDMPIEILDDAIGYAFETAKNNALINIKFSFAVGGEPTAKWDLFTYCVSEIKEHERKYNIPTILSITTNGYYNINKREFIANNFNKILLSVDGMPEIQNLHRPSLTGKDSYTMVKESALYYLKNAKTFSIRSTVSNISVIRMSDIVQHFFDEFGNKFKLVFEPLVPIGRATKNLSIVHEPTQKDFIRNYILARELGKKLGIDVRTSASNHNRLVTSFCGAMSVPSFIVTTKGIITACERDSNGDSYSYGSYDKGNRTFNINSKKIEENKKLLDMPKKCNECFCKWHCAGDCPDIRNLKFNRCDIVRSLMKYELESKIKY